MAFTFAFEYEVNDLRKGIALNVKKSCANKVIYGVMALALLRSVLYFATDRVSSPTALSYFVVTLLITVLLLVLVARYLPLLLARRTFRSDLKFGTEQQWRLDGEGVAIVTPQTKSEARWESFAKYEEDEDSVLLFPSTQIMYILPKRAIPEEMKEQVLALIHMKVRDRPNAGGVN